MPRENPFEDTRLAKRPRLDGFLPSKPKAQRPPVSFPSISDFKNAFASSSNGAGPSRTTAARKPAFIIPSDAPSKPKSKLRVLKPPVLAPPPPVPAIKPLKVPVLKPATSAPLLRPAIPPPVQPIAGPSKLPVRSILHNPHQIPRPSTPPNRADLKPLPRPPPLASKKVNGAKPAVTSIMQTRIARATDIRTEQGTAEILSIFLQQNGTGYVDPIEREMKRGLEQSPEKRNKAKGHKFIRGGLADSASRHLSASNTNQLLWETDLIRLLKKGQSMKPELHIRITTIVCSSPEHTGNPKSPHAPRVVFIRGTVLSTDTLDVPHGPISALLRLSDHSASTGRKMLSLEEGRDIHVWRPWTCITCTADDGDEDTSTENVWCFSRFDVHEPKRRVPEPFPMPLPTPPDA